MAGEPIVTKCERATTISPRQTNTVDSSAPVHEVAGELLGHDDDDSGVVETDGTQEAKEQSEWQQLQKEVDDLNVRVARHASRMLTRMENGNHLWSNLHYNQLEKSDYNTS